MSIAFNALSDFQDLDGPALLGPLIRDIFPGRIALVSSVGAESAVLLHMVARIDTGTPVIFLDTGKLFEETLAHRDRLVRQLGLTEVRTVKPLASDLTTLDPSGALWQHSPDLCCAIRKVEPLERALKGFQVWITGRKRFHGGRRQELPQIELADWRIKVNPLANWSHAQVSDYLARHNLPAHPLVAEGYPSIGCVPCTAPSTGDPGSRDGRWTGQEKTECGIHWTANGKPIRAAAGT